MKSISTNCVPFELGLVEGIDNIQAKVSEMNLV